MCQNFGSFSPFPNISSFCHSWSGMCPGFSSPSLHLMRRLYYLFEVFGLDKVWTIRPPTQTHCWWLWKQTLGCMLVYLHRGWPVEFRLHFLGLLTCHLWKFSTFPLEWGMVHLRGCYKSQLGNLHGFPWMVIYFMFPEFDSHFIMLLEVLVSIGPILGVGQIRQILWAWKEGPRHLAVVTKAKTTFSMGWYLSSASCRARLTWYRGFCMPSLSWTRMVLIVSRVTTR